MPWLARVYHVPPAAVWDLTQAEYSAILDDYQQMIRQQATG